jgi:hypothetical protein
MGGTEGCEHLFEATCGPTWHREHRLDSGRIARIYAYFDGSVHEDARTAVLILSWCALRVCIAAWGARCWLLNVPSQVQDVLLELTGKWLWHELGLTHSWDQAPEN